MRVEEHCLVSLLLQSVGDVAQSTFHAHGTDGRVSGEVISVAVGRHIIQDAGGVGGLVAVSINGFFYFSGYDNNGNVVGYWDERGRLAAEFVYDAFGNPVGGHDAPYVHLPHRFSTKYHDAETDLYYYGHRYYSPSLGRWISRDPIDEDGGWLFCS